MQTIYRPGHWYLIVIPGALVALPPDVPADVIASLWDRLPAEKTLATVVDVLTTKAGGSFTALPPFVAAVAEGADVRIALRGGVAARVSTAADGAHELSGAEVTTWSERFVGGATRIEITVEAAEGSAGLPVQSSIVRAAAVRADLEPDDAAALVSALGPSPVIEPADAGISASALSGASVPPLALFGAAGIGAGAAALAAVPIPAVPIPAVVPPVVVPSLVVPDAPVIDAPKIPASPPADVEAAPPAVEEAPAAPESIVEPATEEIPELLTSDDAEEPTTGEVEPVPVIDGVTLLPTEVTLGPADDDFDQLFGATVHSVPDVPSVPPAPLTLEGDHDGATISAAELRLLREQPSSSSDETPTAVLPVSGASPAAFGRLRVSTGQVIALDRTVIIGRRPRSTRASGANLPHLIAVESPQQDISRSHLEVRPEGDTVVVIDLHTTNGSTLLRPGADPMRLHPGEQTLVLTGDVVDLGDGVTVAFEDLP